MKKYNKTLVIASAFYALMLADLFADSQVHIINETGKNIQVFVRGKGSNKHHKITLAGKPDGVAEGTYTILDEHVDGRPLMELIASTGTGDSPDWALLGGTCDNLSTKDNHEVVIQKGTFKTSCTTIN